MRKNNERRLLDDTDIDINMGLSVNQIAERTEKNHINDVKIGSSKSYGSIIFGNIFTFFNMLCFAIFIWLITVIQTFSDVKNLTFMVIILINMSIGIIQEIKAKKTMDKLSLLSSPDVKLMRCGEEKTVKLNHLLRGDVILLSGGCQICSDAIIRQGDIEVNESLLTGESLPIKKTVGDTLLSGSFVVSGKCRAEVIHVAEENYIQKLALEAKTFKQGKSELMRSLNIILRIIGFIVIPIGILSFLTNWNAILGNVIDHGAFAFANIAKLDAYTSSQLYEAYRLAVTPTSTALIGVIPAGLVLLTTMALAVGVLRLEKQKALVQELYSIETLARVDILCLDKTGTITDGTMKVREVLPIGECAAEDIGRVVAAMQLALDETNMTANALSEHFGKTAWLDVDAIIPFSSERKCSAVQFNGDSMYILGAPEFVTDKLSDKLLADIDKYAKCGNRCLLLAKADNVQDTSVIPQGATPIAVISIEDNVKEDAAEIIDYFKSSGVAVKVISGDNPVTVSEVAKRVGIVDADKYINLFGLTDDEVIASANKYSVFGRVSPEQKKLLVRTLKADGHTVAMTGDGINDILALKEADCSIAMANGSEATRNVAQLVLLDSNFASMPKVVGEGRRVVNNIERAGTLFLTKTVFSVLLQIMLVIMAVEFPLMPIQLSFIAFFCIGLPSFFLAIEPNNKKIEGKFLTNVTRQIIPGAVAVVVNVMMIMIFCQLTDIIVMPAEMLRTVVLISIYTVFMQVLYHICKPFNANRAVLFIVIAVWSIGCFLLMPLFATTSIVNLFYLVYVTDFSAIFMIFALLLLSMTIMKSIKWCFTKFDYTNKRLIYKGDIKGFWKGFLKK